MPENCDAACVKIIIDTGMGVFAANLYSRSLVRRTETFAPVDYEAATFYADFLGTLSGNCGDCGVDGIAQQFNRAKLNEGQRERLMAQVQKTCYRADSLIEWSRVARPTAADVAQWTERLFTWAKDDQNFYTAFAAEC
jgi:hypothetical protein